MVMSIESDCERNRAILEGIKKQIEELSSQYVYNFEDTADIHQMQQDMKEIKGDFSFIGKQVKDKSIGQDLYDLLQIKANGNLDMLKDDDVIEFHYEVQPNRYDYESHIQHVGLGCIVKINGIRMEEYFHNYTKVGICEIAVSMEDIERTKQGENNE